MAPGDRLIADQWTLIKDIIGSASLWPRRQLDDFFGPKNLSRFQRFLVVCFCYVNGLSPADFWDWANLLHLCRGQAARQHRVFIPVVSGRALRGHTCMLCV